MSAPLCWPKLILLICCCLTLNKSTKTGSVFFMNINNLARLADVPWHFSHDKFVLHICTAFFGNMIFLCHKCHVFSYWVFWFCIRGVDMHVMPDHLCIRLSSPATSIDQPYMFKGSFLKTCIEIHTTLVSFCHLQHKN